MRRESAVPIDEELEAEIRDQQQRVTDRWPEHHPHLFPGLKGNATGQHPMTYYSYRSMLNSWLATCQISDEHGDPVQLTLHQWRHTLGTRMINRDVPKKSCGASWAIMWVIGVKWIMDVLGIYGLRRFERGRGAGRSPPTCCPGRGLRRRRRAACSGLA